MPNWISKHPVLANSLLAATTGVGGGGTNAFEQRVVRHPANVPLHYYITYKDNTRI
jgi:hypothetical protein